LTPPDPQLKGAWYPGGFNPGTYQVKNRFQNVPFKVTTCTATARKKAAAAAAAAAAGGGGGAAAAGGDVGAGATAGAAGVAEAAGVGLYTLELYS
jgi:hypothetical protein